VSRITREEVANLARLARLDLAESELDEYAQQLEIILESVAKVSTKDVKPMSHATGLVNIFREDITKESLKREEILRSAPASEDDRFRVPRILDEE
jgi:aspartyl-tRNA(Asn)/glutamyl-tRNA(Gln) amidotransferase subunit C